MSTLFPRGVLVLLSLGLALGDRAARAADGPDALTAALDALVAPHFSADRPGAVVLVRKGERVLLRKAYGLAELEPRVPLSPEHAFRIGSLTKAFTAAAIMVLVERGKLALTDDVRKFVPQLPDKGAVITIEHLLTHTGGVPSYTDQARFRHESLKDLSHDELLALFKDLPLDFAPGQRQKYSNSGYYLLGLVIEKVAGVSYADFLATQVWKPLGMSASRYGDTGPRRARGFQASGQSFVPPPPISMKPPFSAGALVSTVDDLARWDAGIAAGKLLSPAGWKRVFSGMKLKDGSTSNYGFGWALGSYEGRATHAHAGGIPGFKSEILRMPAEGVVVVLLSNFLPTPPGVDGLPLRLAALAIGRPVVDPTVVKLESAALEALAGVYKRAEREVAVRRDADRLSIAPRGAPPLTALPSSDLSFFVAGTPVRFRFERATSGRVVALEIKRRDGTTERFLRQ